MSINFNPWHCVDHDFEIREIVNGVFEIREGSRAKSE